MTPGTKNEPEARRRPVDEPEAKCLRVDEDTGVDPLLIDPLLLKSPATSKPTPATSKPTPNQSRLPRAKKGEAKVYCVAQRYHAPGQHLRCDLYFDTVAARNQHALEVHSTPFVCPVDGCEQQPYQHGSILANHMLKTHGRTLYVCAMAQHGCTEVFLDAQVMGDHARSHNVLSSVQ